MTMTEIPSWKKWGLLGVFEWHENQILATRFFHTASNELDFKYIFFLHFLNGSLAGIAFPLILSIMNIDITQDHILLFSVVYGFVLWIATLVPIHKPITGNPLWNHNLGHLPSIASLYWSFDIRISLGYCNDDVLLTSEIGELIKT